MKIVKFILFSVGVFLLSATNAALAGIGGIAMSLFPEDIITEENDR